MTTRPAMQRPPHYVLDKIVRASSWPLIVVVLVFMATGYIMRGQYGLGGIMDAKEALAIHNLMHVPLVVLVVLHSVPAMYLAFRRWRWIGKDKT